MVLGGEPPGRVGRRRISHERPRRASDCSDGGVFAHPTPYDRTSMADERRRGGDRPGRPPAKRGAPSKRSSSTGGRTSAPKPGGSAAGKRAGGSSGNASGRGKGSASASPGGTSRGGASGGSRSGSSSGAAGGRGRASTQ